MGGVRLDKWLWAARFYKTRALAVHEVSAGRVLVNDQSAKPSRELAVGDLVLVRKAGARELQVRVCELSAVRGPAPVAARLYAETPESIARRERQAEQRRLAPEPADDFSSGRPTKRDRRLIDELRGR